MRDMEQPLLEKQPHVIVVEGIKDEAPFLAKAHQPKLAQPA